MRAIERNSSHALNYRFQPTPYLSLMPNVQYVIQPNGLSTIANALVLGLQAKVTF